MRSTLIKLATVLLAQGIAFAHASDISVGVSVSGEVAPGVYGRVDIGNTPPPVLYAQPVIIKRAPRPVAPVYMHVPPGHAKKWDKHCHKYNACGTPVYFVKSAEYEGGGKGPKEKKNKHGRGNND
ncbi:MAG TPA: hypothetical protein VGE12_04040 [Noviherbaspirillum sp.]